MKNPVSHKREPNRDGQGLKFTAAEAGASAAGAAAAEVLLAAGKEKSKVIQASCRLTDSAVRRQWHSCLPNTTENLPKKGDLDKSFLEEGFNFGALKESLNKKVEKT